MTNKIIIGVLVFLILISGGLGVYSVNLNRQINTLSTEVIAFKGETATEISDVKGNINTLDSELTTFKGETTTQVSSLRGSISTLDSELTTFKGVTTTQISGLRGSISTLDSGLTAFKGDTTTQISGLRGSISTLDSGLTAFKGDTTTQISSLRGSISTLDSELTTFKGDTTTQISSLRGSISTLDSELTAFKEDTTTQISGITNVAKIYESVSKVVVEISDGEEVLGSGFIFDSRGYIITAQHVIDGLTQIDVILHDGSIASASIVGSSQYSDVAVLKLKNPVTLEPLELADSNTVVPGEPVMTLGTPFALSGTVTEGIISKTGGAENYRGNWLTVNLIQYDAATNPGNSGGPLVNAKGEIIGMVVAGVAPTEGSGINWAVSSNMIKRVADAIIASGSFKTATLPGTWQISDLTPEKARDRNMETTNGVLFLEASGMNGIQADDIVIAVDGVPVREYADLFNYFGEYKSPGDTVTLTVIRDGTEVKVAVKLVEGWVFTT